MGRTKSSELNGKEDKVLAQVKGGVGEISAIADRAFPSQPKAKGNSWVRNSLRKLLRLRLVKHVGGARSGEYASTGRERPAQKTTAASKSTTKRVSAPLRTSRRTKESAPPMHDRIEQIVRRDGPMTHARMASLLGATESTIRRSRAKTELTEVGRQDNVIVWGFGALPAETRESTETTAA